MGVLYETEKTYPSRASWLLLGLLVGSLLFIFLVFCVMFFSVFCLPSLCFLWSVLPGFLCFVCLRYASCGQCCLFFCVLFSFAMLLVVSVACFSLFCLPSLCFLWSVLPVFLYFVCLRYAFCGQCCLFFWIAHSVLSYIYFLNIYKDKVIRPPSAQMSSWS